MFHRYVIVTIETKIIFHEVLQKKRPGGACVYKTFSGSTKSRLLVSVVTI